MVKEIQEVEPWIATTAYGIQTEREMHRDEIGCRGRNVQAVCIVDLTDW